MQLKTVVMKKKKKTEESGSEFFQMRIKTFNKNRLKILADKYAGGDMTAWALHGILNAPRKFLVKK